MEFLQIQLKEFSIAYRQSVEQIREIEDESGMSAHNRKYLNNMRNCIEHLVIALEKAYSNPPDQKSSEEHMREAIHEVTNLASDACEYIAGPKLKEAEKHIMRGVSLSERREAIELYKKAKHHWNQGRDIRTANPHEANKHFTKAVKLCNEAMLSVRRITKVQWIILWLMLLGALSGWATFLAKMYGLF